jgi:hypothetical protein
MPTDDDPQAAGNATSNPGAAPPPVSGNCFTNGHFGICGTPRPLTGVKYPYSEDIATSTFAPCGFMTVSFDPALPWTKIQSGCTFFGECNANGVAPFNLSVRCSPSISVLPPAGKPNAPVGARYEIKVTLAKSLTDPNPIVIFQQLRRMRGVYPQSDKFGGTLTNVPAGNYVCSMWCRLLDAGNITFDYQWLNVQGFPATFPAQAISGGPMTLPNKWTAVGNLMPFNATEALDLTINASFQLSSQSSHGAMLTGNEGDQGDDDDQGNSLLAAAPGTSGDVVQIGFSLDGKSSGDHFGTLAIPAKSGLPLGFTVFDHVINVPPGSHTLQMFMRTQKKPAQMDSWAVSFLSLANTDSTGFATLPGGEIATVSPMLVASASNKVTVSSTTTGTQPMGENPAIGLWTMLLEIDMPPQAGPYSWMLEGYVEFLGNLTGSQLGELMVEAVIPSLTPPLNIDVGRTSICITNYNDGVYFHGDANKWGNTPPNRLRLYAHQLTAWGNIGGAFDVGKRWFTVKLVPSDGPNMMLP